jgi:hypothetical protein
LRDLPSQETDLLAGYINAALLYAHLAALKAAQQLAQAGQCVGTLVSRPCRHHRQFLGSRYGFLRLKLDNVPKVIRAACLAAFQKSSADAAWLTGGFARNRSAQQDVLTPGICCGRKLPKAK